MMMEVLAFIGILSILCAVFCVLEILRSIIADWIERAHIRNVQKHRFDKPPTAKCYCIDCVRHGADGRCGKFDGWYTGDGWFCWDAEPSKTIKSDTEKGD